MRYCTHCYCILQTMLKWSDARIRWQVLDLYFICAYIIRPKYSRFLCILISSHTDHINHVYNDDMIQIIPQQGILQMVDKLSFELYHSVTVLSVHKSWWTSFRPTYGKRYVYTMNTIYIQYVAYHSNILGQIHLLLC